MTWKEYAFTPPMCAKLQTPKLLARHFGMSVKSLYRLAKNAFGMPMHKYVIALRMQYAIQQLHTTNKPIHEIAFHIGYKDPGYFSQALKKYYNLSLADIRRLHK